MTLFRDIFGVALTKMIEGGDPKTLLEAATKSSSHPAEESGKG